MRNFIVPILLALCSIPCSLAYAESREVTAEGFSSLSAEDAVRQAQRAAVEQGIGVFVHSETEVANFEVQKDKVMSRSEGYVTRFDILGQDQQDGVYHVKIRATVSLDKIRDDLVAMKILLESMERPKVMILVDERYVGMDDLSMRLAETELAALLGAKGFDLVDQAQLAAIRESDQKRQALAGNDAAAQSLGFRFGAQYVLIGKAVVQDAGEAFAGSGLRSLQASLQLKILQTQSGLILGSVVKNGVAAHVSPLTGATEALRKAAAEAIDGYAVNAITDSFQDFLNNGAPLKLHVTGITSFSLYKKTSTAIENLNRVMSSTNEGWNREGGIVVLDLRFKGTSEELAEMLDGLALDTGRLEVTDFAPDRVDCALKVQE